MKYKLFLILYIGIFVGCNSTKQMTKNKTLDLQGHRGCRGLMPENTMPAFLKAIDYNVTTLEMDVCITKDKKVIISHEPFFNHEITTTPKGDWIDVAREKEINMYLMNFDSIKKYDVGIKNHPRFEQQHKILVSKPLLNNMFDTVAKYCLKNNKPVPYFNIEIKSLPFGDNIYHPTPDEFVELVVNEIKLSGFEDKINIQSFDQRPLKILHKKYPKIKIALLVEDTVRKSLENLIKDLGFTPDIYSPHHDLITPELVKYCHTKKIKLIPWTINKLERMKELKDMGVDGIISDYPNLFLQL